MALNYNYPNFNISRDRFINSDDGTQTFNEIQQLVERLKDFHREAVSNITYGNDAALNVSIVTDPTVVPSNSPILLCDASSNNISVNLPAALDKVNYVYHIKKTDNSSNIVTINGNGSETIDGTLTKIITSQYVCVTVVSDGSNWFII